jgi:hypothetical protein
MSTRRVLLVAEKESDRKQPNDHQTGLTLRPVFSYEMLMPADIFNLTNIRFMDIVHAA